MKVKKILAFGLVASMTAAMALGVSASDTVIKEAASGDIAPSNGSADVAVEGVIEPTENTTNDDDLQPTDPSGSTVTDGWDDDLVANTSQLLVTAPTAMKFVVRGEGADLGNAALVEGVSGTIKNASAYIPANDATVRPKKVTIEVNAINLQGTPEFNLHPKDASDTTLQTFTNGAKGAVKGLGVKLGEHDAKDFGSTVTTPITLGTLEKGTVNSQNAVSPSEAEIKFVDDGLKTAFINAETGRLLNNYKMGLTFTYQK